jgi:hypothetical protein
MPTVTQVRDELARVITVGAGLRAAALVQDTMVAPIAIVSRRPFDPRMIFSQAKAAYQFTVTIYVDRTDERAAQRALDNWCEIRSIDLVVETDEQLDAETGDDLLVEESASVVEAIQNGANWLVDVDYAQVTQIGEVQAVIIGESNYLAVPLDVEVVF